MKRYKVETQREGSVKYFFIRDMESLEIVLLPSKYLMHQVRANRSPNTIRRNAFALAYYWEYLLENDKKAEDIYAMDYETQYDYFAEYLKWLKAPSGKPESIPTIWKMDHRIKPVTLT